MSNVVEESRSFYDEEDGEDDDQEGDEDDDQEGDEDEDPLPTKANAGSPGSGGSAATPAESLRNDGSCPQLAEEDGEEDDPPLSKTHMVNTDVLYSLQGVKL